MSKDIFEEQPEKVGVSSGHTEKSMKHFLHGIVTVSLKGFGCSLSNHTNL